MNSIKTQIINQQIEFIENKIKSIKLAVITTGRKPIQTEELQELERVKKTLLESLETAKKPFNPPIKVDPGLKFKGLKVSIEVDEFNLSPEREKIIAQLVQQFTK